MTPQPQGRLKLRDEDTRQEAIERLTSYFSLQVSGYECNTEMVFDVLVKAAVTRQTIETVCRDLEDVVDGETIRGYLNEQVRVDDLHSLEQQVNQALVAGLPRRLWKPRLEIALDLHDAPSMVPSPLRWPSCALIPLTSAASAKNGGPPGWSLWF